MTENQESRFDRWVEFSSVVLISAATVLTAWCGYEAARWTALETRHYNEASAQRVAATAASARANALETIDVVTFLQYVGAVAAGRDQQRDFIYRRLRPEMRPAMDAWLAAKPLRNFAAPSTPFAMPQYRLHSEVEAARLNASATASFQSAASASELGDWYVRLTVIFAAVSFLAGVSTRFVSPNNIYLVVVGFGILVFGLLRMFVLPVR
ncbi:MAG: hypothetical protein ABI231_12575 [Candidatus Tumulicola sp.]